MRIFGLSVNNEEKKNPFALVRKRYQKEIRLNKQMELISKMLFLEDCVIFTSTTTFFLVLLPWVLVLSSRLHPRCCVQIFKSVLSPASKFGILYVFVVVVVVVVMSHKVYHSSKLKLASVRFGHNFATNNFSSRIVLMYSCCTIVVNV